MALHVTLLEARNPAVTGAVARTCAAADASLHLVGPLGFASDDDAFRAAGPADWDSLDWWFHPGWRDFRDAMSRERCLYFAAEGTRDPANAPFRPNSVLVFGDEHGAVPERIREKYPERLFRLPAAGRRKSIALADHVAAVLALAGPRMSDAPPPRPKHRRRR